ncbi:MAG: RHS repeat protein [Candidatus Omnitrophica bacterium]|nr:RHS repeat protein [Candidatus Omnitrophota bacterium]
MPRRNIQYHFKMITRQCALLIGLALLFPCFAAAQTINPKTIASSMEVEVTVGGQCFPDDPLQSDKYNSEGSIFLQYSLPGAPYNDPTSPVGYWTGSVHAVGKTQDWIVPAPSGRVQLYWYAGCLTAGQRSAAVQSQINENWHIVATFVNPDGTRETVTGDIINTSHQKLGEKDMSFDPKAPESLNKNGNNKMCQGDPVYMHSGQFAYQCNDINIPGRKLDVDLQHAYSSGTTFNGPFGYGWMLNYYMRLHSLRNGNVVIVGGNGEKTQYILNGSSYTPPAGRFESLNKNGDGSWTLTLAHGETYHFDPDGKLASIRDRNNNTITLTYDLQKQPIYGFSPFSQASSGKIQIGSDYRLLEVTDTTGRELHFNYNTDGLLVSIVNQDRTVRFSYDPNTHDLLSVTKPAAAEFPDGVAKSFTYENHKVKKMQDAKLQYFVENFYDSAGRVMEQNLGGASFHFDYSVADQTTMTDRKGYVTTYSFNPDGNVLSETIHTAALRQSDPASFTTSYTYNADSMKTSVTYPKGNGVKFVYDKTNPDDRGRGNLLQIRKKTDMTLADDDINDIVVALTYEPRFNQMKTITDALGRSTNFLYDYELPSGNPKYAASGNVVKITSPTVIKGTPVTEFTYNAYGQVTQKIDANGKVVQYAYDPNTGYLTDIVQDPSGINAVTHMTYDVYGNLDVVTDAENKSTDYDYNALGWLNKVTTGLGFATKYFHDANGNLIRVERQMDPGATQWQVTQMTYDILNHLKTSTDPLARVTTYNYDNNENLASVVDSENHATTYEYDERDKLLKATDANDPPGVTQTDYDANANLKKITDANNHATNYEYDLFDRQAKEIYADASYHEYTFDKNGNLKIHRVPDGKTIEYDYDELNRLTAKRYPSNPGRNAIFDYDLGGRLESADNAAVQIHNTYDNLNRIATTIYSLSSNLYPLAYNYYKNGQLKSLTYPSSKLVEQTYDNDNRLDLVKAGGTTIADYNYDPLNRLSSVAYPQISTEQNYLYDPANQLLLLTNQFSTGGEISSYAYPTHDKVGNRTRMDVTRGTFPAETINYSYNNIYELKTVTGAQNHAFDYDNVGNRLTADGVNYTSNALNQYLTVNSSTFGYDTNGNLASDGAKTFTYDEENHLISSPSSASTYAFDAFGRRLSKTVNGTTTYFIYNGDDIIEERNATGELLRDYVHGPGVDEVLTMSTTQPTATYYYFRDGLGSTSEILNGNGNLAESYDYASYGNTNIYNSSHILQSSSSISNPYMFTGREFDPETNLYHYRARAYDLTIGRFLQRDPIGTVDDVNLYRYVRNRPTMLVDPYGLYSTEEFLQDTSNFSAGVGDSLSFGLTKGIRQSMGSDAVVQSNSGLYTAGVVSSFAFGAGRLAYSGTAKVASVFYGTTPTLSNAMKAVELRNQLKIVFSLNPFRTTGIYSFEQVLSKYKGSADAIIQASGRTNLYINALGLDAFLGSLMNSSNYGCKSK